MKLREMGADEQPREKLLEKGPEALSNAEILAILLRTGTGGTNVLDLARMLLRDADGSLVVLSTYSPERLEVTPGIGPAKAVSLAAAFELGRRFAAENIFPGRVVTGPGDIARELLPFLKGKSREECWIVFLSAGLGILHKERLSLGSEKEASIGIRYIVTRALERKAAAVILVHNHPGGNPLPSKADIRLTDRLRKTLSAVDLKLMDHVILSDNAYFSFANEKISEV